MLAEKMLQAFFFVGGRRRHAQLVKPRKRRNLYQESRAESIRARRKARNLQWRAVYDLTYYRAPQLPGFRGPTLRQFLQHTEEMVI